MKSSFVISLLILFSFAQAVAQQFHYNQFTTVEGLPTNAVRSSLIDSRGWLWIGTDAGVVRYQDGFFISDNRLDTLSGMRVWAMAEDDQHKLWFGTYGNGLAHFDGDSLVWYNSENSPLAANEIRILKYLPNHRQLLIGGKDAFAVYDYNEQHLTNFKLDRFASPRHFTDFLEDKGKIMALNNIREFTLTYYPTSKKLEQTDRNYYPETKHWSGIHTTANETYYGFNRDSYYYKSAEHEFVKPGIGQVFEWLEDPYGNVWAAAWEAEGPGGLFRFNKGEMVNYNKMLGIEKINGWGLEYDKVNDCLWFLSLDQGLIQLPTQIFSSLPLPFQQKSEKINAIQQDSANNIWISTTKSLWHYNGKVYETIPNESFNNTLLNTYITNFYEWFSVLERADLTEDNILDTIGNYFELKGDLTNYNLELLIKILDINSRNPAETYKSAFSTLKDELIQKLHSSVKKPLPFKFNKILALSMNKILVSTSLGTFSYALKTQKITYLNSLWDENVTLNQDTLYYTFNFNQEVLRAVFNGKETIGLPWMKKEKYPDLPQFTVASEARASRMWFASRFQGLFSYFGGKFTHLNKLYPGLSNNFTSLAFAGDSLLVAGSTDGFVHVFSNDSATPKLIKSFSSANGLSGRTIQWIKCDDQGFLWVGTNSALNHIDLNAWLSNNSIDIKVYGIADGYGAFDVNAALLDHQGRIWVENEDELLLIDTRKANAVSNIPLKPELRQVDLFLKPFDWQDQKNISAFSKVPLNPSFEYDQNYLSFHYGSNNRIDPQNDFYSYRLLGLDTTWSQPGNEQMAVFTNLDPGEYTLEVQLFKPIHKMQGSISYPFSILKPWWQQWWFITLAVLASIALLFTGMNWRIRYLRQQQKRKYEIQQQLAELKLQALQAQMNPHFIFNVLTAIQNAILKNEIDNAIRYLSDVSRLMRRTLDYASEKLISLEEEVEYIENYIRLEKIRMNGKLETHIFVDPDLDQQNTQIPPMLLQPLIENAIKHGAARAKDIGIITIRFKKLSPEGYQCIVEDNGPGIAPESNSLHKSRGLDMIHTRIQLLNEEYGETAFSFIISNKIKPESGARMEVQLKIPLD